VAVVAVRKVIVLYLKEIFYRTSLNLKIIDVDLFAAIRALIENIKPRLDGLAAIVDYSERGVDLCVIREGRYYSSTEVTPSREGSGLTRFTEVSDAEMAKIVSDELEKLLSANRNFDVGIQGLKRIYLTGSNINKDFISELEKVQPALVNIANPFKNNVMSFGPSVEMEEHPERFLVNVGLALRREI